MSHSFKALVISENAEKQYVKTIIQREISDLPVGEVLIKVEYSALNYKDALSSVGNKGVSKNYPHTPGIDAAGVVEASDSADFQVGDQVIVTSYDLGMNTAGGLAEYIRVPAKWIVKLPDGLTLKEAMINGTAGFTAGMCINALLNHGLNPEKGKVLVTGSTGGVGTLAIAMLAKLGFEVVAVTGKPEAVDFLKKIGAREIVGREALDDQSGRPLLKSVYAGVVDTVGGNILATALKSLTYGGSAAICGLVASAELHTTVLPFILRGNTLFGIDSAECPMPLRQNIWQKLATDWKPNNLALLAHEISLEEVPDKLDLMLKGKAVGKTIVKL
ncbi:MULTISPECIES: YhdH/YhfP family quinone oxidoreductase [unclassified Arcicella]|uniref:YhdH/YhfP family quinone oxidoreductase n=1 Tax=unclassified Arcicella TaxID=2644986 RepID=UPI002862A00D|nr:MULTISPECIES: YhdH/YhfP family quinone oxidoreductase [unclassified Arcicella]MDR6564976.1 putative YhdH/YhfP family quinone oxidoreductase [Arcicella sp. BE51]MDR6814789.1 putative YhdH/YhfP family quinone oxidoreductase [Arcicella sp. BE140]MDR6826235.1 putative YhdH/YhfP family quinone oxidoreductase [Arcicella sp. BE139]